MSTLPINQFFTSEPWIAEASCSGLAGPVAAEIFFPSRGTSLAPARAICGACLVSEECLDFALRTGQTHGVWGGKSERERRGMRRQLGIRKRPEGRPVAMCGTESGYNAHRSRGEDACDDCKFARAQAERERRRTLGVA